MSRPWNRVDGDIVRDFLAVADLLEEPQLARLYAYLAREDDSTVQDVMDEHEQEIKLEENLHEPQNSK